MKNEVNRTFTVKKNKFTNFLNCFYANTPQNLGGGNSHSSTVVTPVWKGSRPTVNRQSTDSQSQDHRNHTPISKALKYAAMILMTLTLGVGNVWGAAEVVDCSGASATSSTGNTNKSTSTSYTVYFTRGGGGWSVNSGKGYQGKNDAIAVFKLTESTDVKIIISNSGTSSRTFTATAKPFKTIATGDEFLSILNVSNTGPYKYADCVSSSKNYAELETTSPYYNSAAATFCSLGNTELSSTLSYTTGNQTLDASATSVEYELGTLPSGVYAVGFSEVSNSNVSLAGFKFSPSAPAQDPSEAPTISAHPSTSAAQYIQNAAATALSVTASGSGTVTYQWYSNTTASNASGTVLTNCTTATYTPSTAALGTLYYYCAVTNTEEGKSATTVKSNVSGSIRVIRDPVGEDHVLTWNITVRESSSGESTLGTATTDIGTGTPESTSIYISNQTALTGVGVKRTTNGKSNNTGKIETPASYDAEKYVSFSFDVESGYQFTPTAVSIKTVAVSTAKDLKFEFNDANGSYSVTKTNLSTSGTAATNDLNFSACDVNFTGTVTVKIYVYGAENQYRLSTPLTITGDVAEIPAPVACEAPTTVTVAPTEAAGNYGWRYSKGETIDLTCSYTGGTGTPSYQWQKYVTSEWVDINTATNASAGTARLQIANCASTDGGSYRCVVSKGSDCDLESAGYFVRVFTLNGNYEGEESWLENAITWTGEKTGTATLNLTESSIYNFKVTDNNGKWFGYSENNFILGAINWDCGTENSDCRLFTGPAGNYVATIDITHANDGSPYVNIQLAYPSVSHPAAGYAYFKKWNDWAGYYIHWWYNDGSDHPLTTWGSDVQITNETTICNNDYIYFPVLATYNQLKIKDAVGDGSHSTGDLSSTGSSGKYFDFTNDNAWNTFSTSTISFAGNGNTSGEMSAIEGICPHADQALTANAFVKTGYNFTGWVADVNVTVGESTISAGDLINDAVTLKDITGNITLTAQWESDCPTSGTLFSASVAATSDQSIAAGASDLALTAAQATITGGSMSVYNGQSNAKTLIDDQNSTYYFAETNGNTFFRVRLNCELQAGDEIKAYIYVGKNESRGLWFAQATSYPSSAPTAKATRTNNGWITYTVAEGDGIIGETDFSIFRGTSNTTYFGSLTISRPAKYAVTYSSAKGEAPAGGTVSSVTLAEITGVSGWQNTGWKANVATEVGGESVDANTLIANGTTVTLKEATTFTAQWAQLYTITTGSPANGTVEADKSSAVAGATITLTATPAPGYKLSAWDVYKTDDATTKVSVTNNQFTMPAYGVTISASFIESVVLYDYSVMDNKSFTDETASEDKTGKSKTFGSEGNPQLVVENAGWDSKGNIINSFIKFFGGTSSMSVVIPTGRKATVTIKYGSYNTGRYLLVNGTEQTHPLKALDNDITTSNIDTYMPTVELTNQTGTLVLTANGSNNIYIAYVDVTLTGNASYGVTYHLNDGAWDGDAGAATYTYGTGIATLATNVTRDYHDFAGWYGNEGLTGDAVTSIATSATGDKEFWAAWTPKTYTLTWSWNEGSCSATAGDDYTAGGSVAYGTTLVYPEASTMSKADAAFAGWSSTPATMPAEALTITAQWAPEHAISYKEVKGSDVSAYPTTYVQGVGVASFEPLADVADFHFTGWSPASIGTDATEDVDVTAQWVAAYNVSFSAGEGSGTVPATFQKWATATFELPDQGSMVAPEGKVFVGWKANGAGDTRAANYEYTMTAAAVEFVAQWKVVTLLINYDGENYSLNTTDFQTDLDLVDGVDGTGYEKQAKVKNNITGISNYDNLGKGVMYHSKTNATKVTLYMYNNYTGNNTSTFYYTVVAEGETSSPSVTSESLTKNTGDSYEINMTGRSTLYVFCGQKELRISQIEVEENGTANKVAPEVGYSVNLNKQRSFLPSGVATTFEGITYRVSSNYKPVNAQVQISTCGTDYYSFTIPVGQTRQLQLTVSGSSKYVVSQTLGDNTESKKVSGNQNINLTSGTWYINPQGSNVNITNIAFAAAPAQKSVTFKDGSTTLDTKYVWSGDAVTAMSPAPTKSGYRFVKWQLGGVDYDFATAVTDDIVLDAVWQQTWTVTFDSDGGSDVAAATVDNGAAVAKPADPTKVGFDFVEWQLNSAAYNFASAVTSNITLVATWVVAQTDASLSALSYNSNAIDVNSAVEIEGVQTYTVHLQWGSTVDDDLISVTKSAETATVSEISYDSENLKATFSVESGNHTVTINYAIQFVIDAKRGTSIVKATTNNVVTGLIGGTRDTNLGDGNTKKLDSNTYFGVTLTNDETFQEGDVFIVNITTPADLGKFMIYADKERTELIADQGIVYTKPDVENPVICPTGEMQMVLPEAATGKKSLYLSRENGTTQWNPVFSYVEVTREMNPAIKSFKFGDDAATINEAAKTISIDVPYGTDVTALTPTIEAYGNNGASYTPSGETDFTSPVDYVVTDGYSEFQTTYAVTVNVAAPSENAYLASLSVAGYALDFNKEVENYSIVLNYGTTVLPEITYTVEDAGLATAVKVEGGVKGTTTITVTPQAGAGYEKVYSINFSVNRTPTVAVFDGRTMDAAVVEYTDATSGLSWTNEGAATTSSGNTKTINGRTYTKSVKIFGSATNESRYLKITVPENYMAKFYLAGSTNSSTGSETLFFADEITADKTKSIAGITASVDDPKWVETDYLYSGDYYFCVTGSARIYELSVTLYHIDFTRATTPGRLGTICLEKGGTMRGATLYEVAYFNPDNRKIYFDEIIGGEMEPGMPYVFIPEEDNDNQLVVMYGNNVPAAVAGHHNGLYGSFTKETLTPNDGNYIFSENLYWYVTTSPIYVGQNRAYLKVAQISGYNGEPEPTPAPGRRRVTLDSGDQAPQITTGLENLHAGDQPVKMIINGQIFILRGEKMFDVTGKLVK